MPATVKELRLSEAYSFNVLVRSKQQTFAADLHLSPEIVTLKIMGEAGSARKFELSAWKIDQLCCRSSKDSFLLLGLSLIEGGWRSVGPNGQRYFEYSFEVRELFHIPSGHGITENTKALKIALHSPSVARWLGRTQLQHDVVGHYYKGTLRTQPYGFNIELICKAEEDSDLVLLYDIRDGYSMPEFKSQMSFLPLLGIELNSSRELTTLPKKITDLLAIVSFACGGSLELDRISFLPGNAALRATGSYYRKGLGRKIESIHHPILFPFSTFAAHESETQALSWPRIFSSYFRLSPDLRHLFERYLKYRSLESTEERFLGFFRLLEKLTFQKATFVNADQLDALLKRSKSFLSRYFENKSGVASLIRSIPRLNESKYNTEKCIANLLLRLPPEMTAAWKFTAKELGSVCKLRNDMVHANNHQVSEDDLLAMVVLVELLLTAALAEQVSIPVEESKNYLPRHPHYLDIEKRPPPQS